MNRKTIFLPLMLLALTGCQSGGFIYYSSPQVTGQVLDVNTRQPVPDAVIKPVVVAPTAGEATPAKGGQLLMRSAGVRTDAEGRFTVEAVKVVALFRRGHWHSITLSFDRAGYETFQTNYSAADFKGNTTNGAPWVKAGNILLQPVTP